jgi:2-C-methyl-D-erythritol 4-phosphate cytidylyltransferase/2-C-methyl-D-erythritol 2,4-cyclodiphosphate synthase
MPIDAQCMCGKVAGMSSPPRLAAIIVAAGTGSRFGSTMPKQFVTVAGRAVLHHAAAGLLRDIAVLQPVGDPAAIAAALDGLRHRPAVAGGATRQESVLAGLLALTDEPPDIVLIHDGCRPHVPPGTVTALVAALAAGHDGAIPAVPVADTLKRGVDGRIAATVDRSGLFRAQTPQAFPFATLLALHRAAAPGATDDAGLVEAAGGRVALIPGSEDNIKLTFPEDQMRLERVLGPPMQPRVGTGFDVHVLEAGRPLVLCGVVVPHEKGLAGHSDADVGIHALCDAIYGALAEGDIGRHFPPSEARWKDADSARFLRHAAGRVAVRGGMVSHADVTLICERPKITPHAPAMIARLAELLGVDAGRVSVKATTTERLGFTGRMEGIAAQAVATVLLPG